MRYMLLVYSREQAPAYPESMQQIAEAHRRVMAEATQKGILEGAEPLRPTITATTVRPQNGKSIVLDGPFAETKEQLAGYYILNCKDLDEAIEWAKKIPSSCRGSSGCIEIRPIFELERRP